jgi:hypothetical protein
VIVHDFDRIGAAIFPNEADTPLVIDANGVLTGPIAFSASSRLPGGDFRSSRAAAASR